MPDPNPNAEVVSKDVRFGSVIADPDGVFLAGADSNGVLSGEYVNLTSSESGSLVVNGVASVEGKVNIEGFYAGVPADSAVVRRYIAAKAFSLPVGLTGSVAKAGTAATASTTFSVKKNGSEVATFNFAISATTATFTNAGADSVAAGDVITIVGPADNDATLADLVYNLVGTLV